MRLVLHIFSALLITLTFTLAISGQKAKNQIVTFGTAANSTTGL
jgi:hypothetical protein